MSDKTHKECKVFPTFLNKKTVLSIFFIITIIGALIVHFENSKSKFTVIKSHWPAWDYFQQINSHKYFTEKVSPIFIEKNDIESALNEFIYSSAELATLSTYEAILSYEKLNKNIQIILLLDYTIGSDAIISQPEIRHLTELKNKKIGVEKHTISHYTLHSAMKRSGIQYEDITIIFESQENLIQLFKDKELDAISLYDPYIFDLLNENPNRNILFSSEEIPRKICDVVIAKKEWIYKNKKTIKHLQEKWFKEIHQHKNFSHLKNINNKNYLKNINKKIYLTGKIENKFAFGSESNPGYLYDSILEMSQFLLHKNLITSPVNKDILYYD